MNNLCKILYNSRDEYSLYSIIKLSFINNDKIFNIHEFILKEYFINYQVLINDAVVNTEFKNLLFDESIIDIDYFISYESFIAIIKYLYGLVDEFIETIKKYNLNELFKIHAFINKYIINDELNHLIEKIINNKIINIPFIYLNSINNVFLDNTYIIIKLINGIKKEYFKITEENEEYFVNKILKPIIPINGMMNNLSILSLDFELLEDNVLKLTIKANKYKINSELLEKYQEYLLDDEIYNYVLDYYINYSGLKKVQNNIYNEIINIRKKEYKINEFEDYYKLDNLITLGRYYTLTFMNTKFANEEYINNIVNNYEEKIKQHLQCNK